MSTAYHLRPVSEFPHSPSTTLSTVSPSDHSPQYKSSSPQNGRQSRRPLSPTSLRDVDLSQTDMLQRNPKFPAPPTGHDLMAMFPPAPPDNIPEMRPGPTSGFFQRQERAFFAQAGKEIVRVRVDVDMAHGSDDPIKSRLAGTTRPWASGSGTSGGATLQAPIQSSPGPMPYPHPSSRHRVNVNPSLYPIGPHSTPLNIPPNIHPPAHHPANPGIRTPPQDILGPHIQKPEFAPDEYPAEESWRRPMPYAERRRAGKHTKRVLRT